MVNSKKKLVIAAVILVGLGISLLIVGGIFGGFNGGIIFKENYKIESQKLDKFKNVQVDTDLYDVKFLKGDSYKIEYQYSERQGAPKISVEEGTLYFISKPIKGGLNFDLLNIWRDEVEQTVTIYSPAGADLDKMEVNSDLGSCYISDKTFNKLKIAMDLGDLVLKNIVTNDLLAKLNLGGVEAENITVEDSVFKMDLGELELDEFKSKGLDASLNKGDLQIDGKLEGITTINNDLGSVRVNTDIPIGNYNYNINTELGDVTIDENNSGTKSLVNKDAKNDININASLGDVKLNFGK